MTPPNIAIFIILVIIVAFLLKQPEVRFGQIGSACENFNGLITCSYKFALAGATTTPCAIRSPAATSTIVHASADIKTAATSSIVMTIGKAVNTGTISTLLGSLTLAANNVGSLVATSTLDTSDNLIIAPSNYVLTKFSANFANSVNGTCEVVFRIL